MKPVDLKRLIESRRTTLIGLGLAFATVAAYWQVRNCEFTNYDDHFMLIHNPIVSGGLTAYGILWALSTSYFEYWHPLTWLSHMLDYELFGPSPGWHHLVSLGFHVANTLLLFDVLRRMTGALWRSAIVAALFALHPLHVESVAWLAERKDVLSGFFFMLTLWAYGRYAEGRRKNAVVSNQLSVIRNQESGIRSQSPGGSTTRTTHHATGATPHSPVPSSTFDVQRSMFDVRPSSPHFWYWAAVVMFACGLMSKPMVVTLPFVLLLLDYWPLQRFELSTLNSQLSTIQRLVREKLPFFALTFASCAITYAGVKTAGNLISAEKVPWGLRLANVPVSYARYLWKTIWPTDLIALYPMPGHWAGWLVGGAVLVLALVSLFAVLRARSAPYLIVGWLFFLGVLFPTIGLLQVGLQSIADRYTYLPSIGLFIAVVWAVADWARSSTFDVQRSTFNVQLPAPPAPAPAAPAPPVPEAGAGARGSTFDVQRSTFNVQLPVPPAPAPAVEDSGEGRAGSGFRLGLGCGAAIVALALCGYLTWVQVGYWRSSLTLWTHCLAVDPANVYARYSLGYVLQHSGQTEQAVEQYQAALRIKPDHLDANLNLGAALAALGQMAEATNYFARALRLKPDYAKARDNLGMALVELGDFAGAEKHCREAIRLDPDMVRPYFALARALSGQGKSDEALGLYAEALRRSPGEPMLHYYLGLEWLKRGSFDEAVASLQEALRLNPGWAEARAALERAAKDRATSEAMAGYRETLRADPDSPEALNNLAWILATHPEAQFRNGAEAVQLAQRACERTAWKQTIFIGTLAAACAEAGQFDQAVAAAQKACELAASLGQTNLLTRNQELLRQYQNRQPCREAN